MDTSVDITNKTVVIVAGTWDETLGRLLVNGKRSRKNTYRVDNYTELLNALQNNKSLYAGLVDQNIAAIMQEEMKERKLGKANRICDYSCHVLMFKIDNKI